MARRRSRSLAAALALSGCVSTAGRFVADLQRDRNGDLIIRRFRVQATDVTELLNDAGCATFRLDLSQTGEAPPTSDPAPEATHAPPEAPVNPQAKEPPP